jgi:hypothetical protein
MHCKECKWWSWDMKNEAEVCTNDSFYTQLKLGKKEYRKAFNVIISPAPDFGCVHFEEKEEIYSITMKAKLINTKRDDLTVDKVKRFLKENKLELLGDTISYTKETP